MFAIVLLLCLFAQVVCNCNRVSGYIVETHARDAVLHTYISWLAYSYCESSGPLGDGLWSNSVSLFVCLQ